MRFILTTSLVALALAVIVASCIADVQPTPTEQLGTPTLSDVDIDSTWEIARSTPWPTRTPTPTRTTPPTPHPLSLTATHIALATATEEAVLYRLAQLDFLTTVASGENQKCSESDLERASSALTAGRDSLTGSELAMLIQAHVDALDCSEFPYKDSEHVQCLHDALLFLVPHYDRIGSKRLREANMTEANLLRTASVNSSEAVQRCREKAFTPLFTR